MPQQTIYIRKDDMPKWKALEKKSEFLHNALNNIQRNARATTLQERADGKGESVELPPTFKKGTNLCNIHNLPMTVYGKCLQKGCKYA